MTTLFPPSEWSLKKKMMMIMMMMNKIEMFKCGFLNLVKS